MKKEDLKELAESVLALSKEERIVFYEILAEAKGVTPIKAADGDPVSPPTGPNP